MAVVTSAMLRTWPVRFDAMEFTLSVRSFQVPRDAWHVGLAAELAFGADLARHARHFGREARCSWSTIVLMVSFSCRISPRTSTVILRDRSPRATAVVTSAMLRTWPVRFEAIELTLSVRSFQVPRDAGHHRLAAELAFGAVTAMLPVLALEKHGLTPKSGPVVVTGAAGGVGSVATAVLSKLGYHVIASTGRMAEADY